MLRKIPLNPPLLKGDYMHRTKPKGEKNMSNYKAKA
jgi:hypothetical protein